MLISDIGPRTLSERRVFQESIFLQQKHSIEIGIANNLTLLSVYVPWLPEAFLAWLLNSMCRILLNFAKCYILSH